MSKIYLLAAFVFILTSCRKNCDHIDFADCAHDIIGAVSISKQCKCICKPHYTLHVSPFDKQKFCFNYHENESKGADREVYLYDHYAVSKHGVEERLAGPVFCYFNEIAVKVKLDEFPDQGVLVIRGLSRSADDCMPHHAWQSIPFYLKNGSRDTLFFDQPRDFYDTKYWMCHYYSFIKGFAVRKSDRLEWHFGMYDFQYKTPFDRQLMLTDMTYNMIFPDTVMAFTTMRVR